MHRHALHLFIYATLFLCAISVPFIASAASETLCIEVRKLGGICDASTPESSIDRTLLGVTGGMTPTQAVEVLSKYICPGFSVGYDSNMAPSALKESRVYFTAGTATMDPQFSKCAASFFAEANTGAFGQVCIQAALRSVDHQKASCNDTANTVVCGRSSGCKNFAGCPHVQGIAMDLRQNGSVPTPKLIAFAATKGIKLGYLAGDAWHMQPNGSGCSLSGFSNPSIAGIGGAGGSSGASGALGVAGTATGLLTQIGTALGISALQSMFQPAVSNQANQQNPTATLQGNQGASGILDYALSGGATPLYSGLGDRPASVSNTISNPTRPVYVQSSEGSDLTHLLRNVSATPATTAPGAQVQDRTIVLGGITEGGVRIVPSLPRPQDVISPTTVVAHAPSTFLTSTTTAVLATTSTVVVVSSTDAPQGRFAYPTIDQVAEIPKNIGSGGFYGMNIDTQSTTGFLNRVCQLRPWANAVLARVINPEPFDKYCVTNGYIHESVE